MCIFEVFVRLVCSGNVCAQVECLKYGLITAGWCWYLSSKITRELPARRSLLLLASPPQWTDSITLHFDASSHLVRESISTCLSVVMIQHKCECVFRPVLHLLRVQSVIMKHNDCIFLKTYVYFLNKLFWCRPFIQECKVVYSELRLFKCCIMLNTNNKKKKKSLNVTFMMLFRYFVQQLFSHTLVCIILL